MIVNDEKHYEDLYNETCECYSYLRAAIITYKPWGSDSIAAWLDDGSVLKIKRTAPGRFTFQALSEDDVNKKFSK